MGAWAERSENIDLVAQAFVSASGALRDVVKTKTANTGKFSYSYADLAEVLQMARPILAEHQLVLTQTAESHEIAVVVWTTLLHSSGQYITAQPTRLPTGDTPQTTGSALSYARRYALMAFLGLAADDDDGAAASAQPKKKAMSVGIASRTVDEQQMRQMMVNMPKDKLEQLRKAFKDEFGCGLSDLPVEQHKTAQQWMVGYVSGPNEGA